jgi:hypothetical protein
MATLTQGQAARLNLKASQSITVTPSSAGQATVSANGPSNLVYEQKTIYAAETFGPYVADSNIVISAVIGTLEYTDPVTSVPGVYEDENGAYRFTMPDGSVSALSEVSAYVAATASSGATLVSGACELAGYICTTAAGNITIYDNTSAAGTVIVPTTALVVGSYPIMGAGTNTRLALTTGCHVVLSGAAAVNVLVQ